MLYITEKEIKQISAESVLKLFNEITYSVLNYFMLCSDLI